MFDDLEQKDQKNNTPSDAEEDGAKTVEDMFASVDSGDEKPSPAPKEAPAPQKQAESEEDPAQDPALERKERPGKNSGSFLGVLAPDNFIKFIIYVIILLIIVMSVSYLISGFLIP